MIQSFSIKGLLFSILHCKGGDNLIFLGENMLNSVKK